MRFWNLCFLNCENLRLVEKQSITKQIQMVFDNIKGIKLLKELLCGLRFVIN